MPTLNTSFKIACTLLACSPAFAHEWDSARPDSHAPISVMGDHTHNAGEFMLSYRYMTMEMEGTIDGRDGVSDADVLQNYRATPTDMTTQMHMIGAMYAPNNWLTLTGMAPYIIKSMDHVTAMGGKFTTRAEGLGDLKLGALWKISSGHGHALHLNTTVSVPTGSIDERDDTPVRDNATLPYPMQLGSGTYDLIVGATYRGQSGDLTWGAQVLGTFHTGENDRDYTLGDKGEFNLWSAWKWNNAVSTSLRLKHSKWSNIDGRDERHDAGLAVMGGRQLIYTIDPNLRAGERTDLMFGTNFLTKSGHRFALEYGLPIRQDLEGPQLEVDYGLTVGWQKAF